jgi:NAD(P)-dependent dehydrogenase (short-subunit alcohol dehydrogenase family)
MEDVERLRGEGLEAERLDLADPDSIAAALDRIIERSGGTLDALFNNGAYGQPGAVEDLTREVLREQLETNLLGWLDLTNRIIPIMRRQGHGRIVNNSSVLGLVALPFRGAYNTSKFALEGLSDTLRLELHGSGISVSLIEPGPITSRFRANAYAAFQRNIDREHSAYRTQYRGAEQRLARPDKGGDPFSLGPEAVLKRVIHALESPRPKPRYYVTFPTWLFGTLRRLLPTRALDQVLLRVSRGENR